MVKLHIIYLQCIEQAVEDPIYMMNLYMLKERYQVIPTPLPKSLSVHHLESSLEVIGQAVHILFQ